MQLVRLMAKHLEDTVFLKINWAENKDVATALDVKVRLSKVVAINCSRNSCEQFLFISFFCRHI